MKRLLSIIGIVFLVLTIVGSARAQYETTETTEKHVFTVRVANNTLKVNTTERTLFEGSHNNDFLSNFELEEKDEILQVNVTEADLSPITALILAVPDNNSINTIVAANVNDAREQIVNKMRDEIVTPLKTVDQFRQDLNNCQSQLNSCTGEKTGISGASLNKDSQLAICQDNLKSSERFKAAFMWLFIAVVAVALVEGLLLAGIQIPGINR